MNRLSENVDAPVKLPLLSRISLFIGGIIAAAMSISLFLTVVINGPALYRAEVRSAAAFTSIFKEAATPGVVLAAAWWLPIVICILAFAIVIGGLIIIFWTTWVQQLLAFISRQSAICPTLPWWQRGLCWASVAGAIALLTAACGIFFTAAAVVLINVLVILI